MSTIDKRGPRHANIETIPDIGGFAAANNLLDKTAAEVRAAMGDKFPSTSTIRSFASAL
jgi:hypothetical protein